MTDKLTDSEIVKALECCVTKGAKCTDCPAFIKVDRSNCKKYFKGAFDLINRLQEENERLKGIKTTDWLVKGISKEQLEKEKIEAIRENAYKLGKAEAYKEFAKAVLELFPADKPNTVISRVTVKHILKELIGE